MSITIKNYINDIKLYNEYKNYKFFKLFIYYNKSIEDYFELINSNGDIIDNENFLEDCEFRINNIIKNYFSFIECLIYELKNILLKECKNNNIYITQSQENMCVEEEEIFVEGKFIKRKMKISLKENIKFVFHLAYHLKKINKIFKPPEEWWSDLIDSINIRNEITHPKIKNLEINKKTLEKIFKINENITQEFIEILKN